jgi:parallel beta-helix repeat protein
MVALALACVASQSYSQTWTPPVGIPDPGNWFMATGPVTDVTTGGTSRTFSGTGTASAPVVFRGVGSPVFTGQVVISGSYVVLENIIVRGGIVRFNGNHLVLRNSEVTGNTGTYSKNAIGTAPGSSDIVVFRNQVHDNGQWQSSTENDFHGVTATGPVQRMWVLENTMYHHGGDSVQVGHEGGNSVVGLYVGRNTMHHDRENAVDLKEVSNAVVAENTMYGYRSSGSSEGAAVVIHYCPLNAAIVNNLIYDSQVGISTTSLNSSCTGQTVTNRIVGNVVHGILATGIQGWGTGKITQIVNNTIYNTAGPGIDIDNMASGSVIENNILNNTRGGTIVVTGSATQRNNLTSDPMFVNPTAADFHVRSGSPAVDAGAASNVYSGFQGVYGVSIAFDRDARPRPYGNTWDIGAYEFGSTAAPQPPSNLRITQ